MSIPDLRFPGLASVGTSPYSTTKKPVSYPSSYGSLGSYGTQPAPGPSAPGMGFSLGSQPSAAPANPSPVVSSMSAYGTAPAGPQMSAAGLEAATASAAVPGALDTAEAETAGFWGKDGFGISDLGSLTEIIGGFGSLWSGMQANKLARQAFNFEKDAYKTNLENTTASYNMELEDRIRARYAQNGRGDAAVDAYINKHKLGN